MGGHGAEDPHTGVQIAHVEQSPVRQVLWRGGGPAVFFRLGEEKSELHTPPQILCCPLSFNDTATTEIYTLSLHDALPILTRSGAVGAGLPVSTAPGR